MKERVVVAMSGGVDSSVAAALLRQEGYEVIGMTMCFNLSDATGKKPTCCGFQGIEDAGRVCHKLGIKHYVVNMQKDLEKYVIKDFVYEYFRGRTPNPCVRCNQYLKFDILLKKAFALDAKYLATGHYARIELVHSSGFRVHSYMLKKGKDKMKDQSYFLYRLNQKQLKQILFPLGDYTKSQVRNLARKFNLAVMDKLGSQEICFLPDADYRRFLKHRLQRLENADYTDTLKPGDIVDKLDNVLGQHKGIAFYTIGQREGLGIAKGYPLYIIKIDPRNNRITVGKKEDAYATEFIIKEPHFILEPINAVRGKASETPDGCLWQPASNGVKKKVAAKVRIRYNHKEAQAEIVLLEDKIKVKFKKPQFAITPGQSAVFYDKDIVLGGGIIDEVLA
jgi:tRNA-specific 2-thiouridylase